MVWEKDTCYFYYKHGLLARTIIGQNQVPGLDSAYTLQGWLEGVNSTGVGDGSFDMGGDGKTGNANSNIARDAYGFSLNYFNGDYEPVSGGAKPFDNAAAAGFGFKALHNGNIAAMAVIFRKSVNRYFIHAAFDAIKGIDSTKKVFETTLKKGTKVEQWLKIDRAIGQPVPGNYYTFEGADPSKLGISLENRVKVTSVLNEDTRFLQSTTSDIWDTWTVPGKAVHAQGGEVQLFQTKVNATPSNE